MTAPPCLGSEYRLPLLLPSCSQSLLELHKRRKALTEPEARYYLRQIVLGCQYLHGNRVIHRDLKLGNLFLNEDLEVKIGKELRLQGHLTHSGNEEELGGGAGERKFGRRGGREEEDGCKSGLLIASRILSLGQKLERATSQCLVRRCTWGVCVLLFFFFKNLNLFSLFKNIFFIYLFLAALGLRCCMLFSSCGEWGLLLIAVCGFLVAVASLVVEHRPQVCRLLRLGLQGTGAQVQYLWHMG